jgi:heat shock protein HslJ
MRERLSAVFVALILAGAALGMAGCRSSGSDTDVLDASAWRLTAWTLNSLDSSDFTITAKFADGKISGNSAVNAYSGPYTAGPGEVFSVGDLAVGGIGGIGPDMRAEHAYLTLLGEAKSFKRSGGRLTLFDQHGNESLIFQAAKP